MGGAYAALLAFVVAAVVVDGLMFILAALIASAQEKVIRMLRAQAHQVKQWGGTVLILVGVWLIVLAVWASFFATLFPVGE
jgi:uncharacterized membrane protein YidH (DUF202 family)